MATMPSDLELICDADDPSVPGDIKVISSPSVELNDCDALTGWSDGGASLYYGISGDCAEGSGSIYVGIPTSTTVVMTFTHATSVDMGDCNYLRFWLKRMAVGGWSTHLHFHAHIWESGGAEADNTMAAFDLTEGAGIWVEKRWDISAVAHNSKDAIKYFSLSIENGSATKSGLVNIDYIWGDPGPSSVRAFDGTRVINIYPKMMTGTWEGTGADKVVTLDRKGTPSFIRVINFDTPSAPLIWMNGMGTYSMLEDGAGTFTDANAGIRAVGDGTFTVESAYSPNGMTMIYMVLWDD